LRQIEAGKVQFVSIISLLQNQTRQLEEGLQAGVLAKSDKHSALLLRVAQCPAHQPAERIRRQPDFSEEGTLVTSRRVCFWSFWVTYFMFLIFVKRGNRSAILSKLQKIVGDARNASTRIICMVTHENFESHIFFLAHPI